jgi:hypothetical protein
MIGTLFQDGGLGKLRDFEFSDTCWESLLQVSLPSLQRTLSLYQVHWARKSEHNQYISLLIDVSTTPVFLQVLSPDQNDQCHLGPCSNANSQPLPWPPASHTGLTRVLGWVSTLCQCTFNRPLHPHPSSGTSTVIYTDSQCFIRC